jgi:ABC-type sugar transport system substrate-binding protein
MKSDPRVILGWIVGLTLLFVAGCGGESAGPARPRSTPGATTASKLPHVMLILPTTSGEDLSIMRQVLQDPASGAGRDYIYREGIVRQGMPAAQQAEVIREAMDKKVSALLVVAADPDSVAPALLEARERGLPVVVVGHEVPADGEPFPTLTFASPEEPARRVLAALSKRDTEPPPTEMKAAIVEDSIEEWQTQDLAHALEVAAAEAGVPIARVIPYENRVVAAREAILKALAEDPSIVLILFQDRAGAEAAALVAAEPGPGRDRGIRVGGFVPDLDPETRDKLGNRAVVINRNVTEAAKRAIQMALQRLEGEEIPDRIVIESEVSGSNHDGAALDTP